MFPHLNMIKVLSYVKCIMLSVLLELPYARNIKQKKKQKQNLSLRFKAALPGYYQLDHILEEILSLLIPHSWVCCFLFRVSSGLSHLSCTCSRT